MRLISGLTAGLLVGITATIATAQPALRAGPAFVAQGDSLAVPMDEAGRAFQSPAGCCSSPGVLGQFCGDLKFAFRSLVYCRPASTFCGEPAGDLVTGEDMGRPANQGGGSVEIVPRPWPPEYQEVPPPQSSSRPSGESGQELQEAEAARPTPVRAVWVTDEGPAPDAADTGDAGNG